MLAVCLTLTATGGLSILNQHFAVGTERVEVQVAGPYACRQGDRPREAASRTRHITLARGGPFEHAHSVRVPAELADTVSAGDTVCLLVHTGALGTEWAEVQQTCAHGAAR